MGLPCQYRVRRTLDRPRLLSNTTSRELDRQWNSQEMNQCPLALETLCVSKTTTKFLKIIKLKVSKVHDIMLHLNIQLLQIRGMSEMASSVEWIHVCVHIISALFFGGKLLQLLSLAKH